MLMCFILLMGTYRPAIFCTCEMLKLESKDENFKKKYDTRFSLLLSFPLYKLPLIPHLRTKHLSHFVSCLI